MRQWIDFFSQRDPLRCYVAFDYVHCFALMVLRRMGVAHNHLDTSVTHHGRQGDKVHFGFDRPSGPSVAAIINHKMLQPAGLQCTVVRIVEDLAQAS